MTPNQDPILSYELEQRLRAALAAAAEVDGLRTPDRVERALVAALRSRNRRMLAGRLMATGAIAATVLIGLLLTRPAAPDPIAPVVPSAAAPVPAAVAAPELVTPPAPVLTAQTAPNPVRRRARQRAAAPRERAVEQTDFIPVGNWQAMEPMERGSIIRVRLPKSSLPGFGIPVSADRWNESIPADVVLAEDGSMRAVRFVSAIQ